MRSIRKSAFAVAAAGALVLTAACSSGSSDDGGQADDGGQNSEDRSQSAIFAAVQSSQEASQDASSASFRTEMIMTMGSGADELVLPMYMDGAMSWDPLAMDVTVDMSGYFEVFAELFETDPSEMPPGEYQMRFLDSTMYMGGAMFEAELPEGVSWVEMDIDELAEHAGPDGEDLAAQLEQAENMAQSPADQLGLLLEAPSVEWVDTETVEGQEADLYQGELTLEELLAVDPASAAMSDEDIERMQQDFQELGADTVLLQAWVNEEDLPVRLDMTIAFPDGNIKYSTVYTDYGSGIGADHPDPADVAGIDELEDASFFGDVDANQGGMGGGSDDLDQMSEEELEEFLREMEELGIES